jgi:aromatic-L-amino-acid decarboxylase
LVARGLSVVCFRHVVPGLDDERLDALNKSILERVQLSGEAFLTSTVLEDRFVLRACVVNPRATEADIGALLAAIRTAAATSTT